MRKKFLSLHYNGVKFYLSINGVEIYKLKAKVSEVNGASLCLGSFSKKFLAHNMKKLDNMDMFMVFQLILIVLKLMIF